LRPAIKQENDMGSGFPYDWNWAEQAEQEEAQRLEQAELFDREPALEPLFTMLRQPFETAPCFEPPLDARAPEGFAEAPAGVGPFGCALLNPHGAAPWIDWMCEGMEPERRSSIALTALEEIGQGWGPLSCLSHEALNCALSQAGPSPQAAFFCSQALVALFQPFDDRPAHLEDALRAPSCALLLRFGAAAAHRSPEGASALSGINALLSEAALGMVHRARVDDLLACAAMLLEAGAPPSSAREEPPFSRIVPNADLRDMLMARDEDTALRQAIEPKSAPSGASDKTSSKRL
jgi:hypothetical protein